MSKKILLQAALTRSIIGAFYEVYKWLRGGYLEHLYLAALELEVGLLLHFGQEARFHRVVCENRLKHPPNTRDPSRP